MTEARPRTVGRTSLLMTLRPSRILRNLRQGRPSAVLKLNLSDPRVVELAGLASVDGVWLCMEHVPGDWLGLEHQILAARAHGIDAIVRVTRGSYSEYLKPLEAGASGIMVPHVGSVEEVRQIVEWVRGHPVGKRPMDGGNVDGLFGQAPLVEYIHHSNTENLLILQIESPEALENIEAIAAEPGFDMLLFGAGDFSCRLGLPGEVTAPPVVEARRRVAAAARRHGKYVMSSGLFAPLDELLAEGHQVFSVGADVIGLGEYFRRQVKLLSGRSCEQAGNGAARFF